jgi:hypothetical protein
MGTPSLSPLTGKGVREKGPDTFPLIYCRVDWPPLGRYKKVQEKKMARKWTVKSKLALLAILCFFVASAASWLWLLKEDQIKRARYDHIPLGMSLKEVQAILGEPGIYYSFEWAENNIRSRDLSDGHAEGLIEEHPENEEPGKTRIWAGRDADILIHLGQDDRVIGKGFMGYTPLTFLERIRHRLRW